MLFHADVWLPSQLHAFMPKEAIKLSWSLHALDALKNDRYGCFQPPLFIHPKEARAVEIEFDGKKVTKVLYRIRNCNSYDLCIVVMPATGVVKTAWANLVIDTHKTLDASKYVKP